MAHYNDTIAKRRVYTSMVDVLAALAPASGASTRGKQSILTRRQDLRSSMVLLWVGNGTMTVAATVAIVLGFKLVAESELDVIEQARS